MKKNIFLSLLFFVLGFLVHSFFFPDFLANGISDVEKIALPDANTTQNGNQQAFETKISFDGDRFSRHNIAIEVGSYLIITNTSPTKGMWLIATTQLLSTKRSYAESEAVRVRLDDRAQYVVADKNNPQEKLVITVK